jgi:hypothetical protein
MTQRPELMKVALPAVERTCCVTILTAGAGVGSMITEQQQDSKETFEHIKALSGTQRKQEPIRHLRTHRGSR